MKLFVYFPKAIIFFFVMLFFLEKPAVLGQQQKTYRLKSLDHSREVLPYKERYQFDQFIKGKVYLTNGDVNVARFNYNFLTNEIQFLNNNNDTLSLLQHNLVRFARIGDSVYYKDERFGYVQMIEDLGNVKLGRKQGMVSIGADKSIGYDQYIPTAATDNSHAFISSTGQITRLDKKTAIIITHKVSYFFIDANGKLFPALRGSLMKIFSKYREQVLDYLNKNEVDYKSQVSLSRLLEFCNKLENPVN